jgi:predicted DCC family thiol-disulfide oxidoreductase YuxK
VTDDKNNDGCLSVLYDGACPFCAKFVMLYKLKNIFHVNLIDARGSPALVEQYHAQGYDANDGMLVLWRGRVYHGAEAMHVLAYLSNRRGIFNKLNRWIFGNQNIGRCIHPLFALVRKLVLRFLGRNPLTR